MNLSCWDERKLLLLAGLVILNGLLAVTLTTAKINYFVLLAALGIFIGLFIAHFVLQARGHRGDPVLLPVAAVLMGIGLTMILRLKPDLILVQAVWVIAGLIAYIASALFFRNMLESLAEYKYICGIIGIGLLLVTVLLGVDIGGNKNWIIIGPVRFQPAEFAKIFIVLFLSAYLDERREVLAYATNKIGPFVLPHPRFIAPMLAIWGFTMLMLVFQRDLGAALMYFSTALIMTYIASGRVSYVTIGGILFFIGSLICYKFFSHVQVRVDIWLNPWSDPNGKAYQIVQSLFALGSGGVFGSGLTYGFPTIIPEVHTDFIFSAIGEELGLAGAGLTLLLYMLIVYRGFRTALLARDSYSAMVAGGLSVFMGIQIFLIIAGVTKFFPLTGITLPWISYGGSSMVSSCTVLGMLYAISERELGTTDV